MFDLFCFVFVLGEAVIKEKQRLYPEYVQSALVKSLIHAVKFQEFEDCKITLTPNPKWTNILLMFVSRST